MWRLNNPHFLFILIALGIIALLYFKYTTWQAQARNALASAKGQARIFGSPGPRWHPFLIWAIPFVCIVFAASDLRYGFALNETQSKQIDVLIALDVSQSMMAEDTRPNRLAFAKRMLAQWITQSDRQTRIGLMLFAGTAQIEAPPTLDHAYIQATLASIETGDILEPGTDLAACFRLAKKAMHSIEDSNPLVLLLTDAEDHSEESFEALKKLVDAGVLVLPIGLGTSQGAPVPSGGEGGSAYLKDETGVLVRSTLNEGLLAELGKLGGTNTFLLAETGQGVIGQINQITSSVQKGTIRTYRSKDFISRYRVFLIPACLLLFWAIWKEKQ
jgi:Ca-activated chloride channel homolog